MKASGPGSGRIDEIHSARGTAMDARLLDRQHDRHRGGWRLAWLGFQSGGLGIGFAGLLLGGDIRHIC